MTDRFHVNNEGKPGKCTAKINSCKFGGDSGEDNHFATKEEARKHYEETQDNVPKVIKKTVKINKKSKKDSRDTRVYDYYRSLRATLRNSSEKEYKSGSNFNNICESVSTKFKMPIEDVRRAIYKNHAKDNDVSVEESKEHFGNLKKSREASYIKYGKSGIPHTVPWI